MPDLLVRLYDLPEPPLSPAIAAEGSAIRRIGHERWLRNLAVALGNAPTTPAVVDALHARADDASPLVREHVAWALARHTQIPAK